MRWLCLMLIPLLAGCAGSGLSAGPSEFGPQFSMRQIDPESGRGQAVEMRWKGGPHLGFRWHF